MGFVLLHSLEWEWQRDLNNKKIIRILMSIIYLLNINDQLKGFDYVKIMANIRKKRH